VDVAYLYWQLGCRYNVVTDRLGPDQLVMVCLPGPGTDGPVGAGLVWASLFSPCPNLRAWKEKLI
jgi:hypothetical protein